MSFWKSAAPKAIAIDLDGTLLNSQTCLSGRSYRALIECLRRGIPLILATSRPARIFERVFPKDLTAVCSMAIMNGAVVKGRGPLSGFFKEELPAELAERIIDMALEFSPKTRVTVEIEGYEFGANWSDDRATLWERNSATPEMVLSVEEALQRHPCKIALSRVGDGIFDLADIIAHRFNEKIAVVPALLGSPLLNVTSPHASKPEALKKLLTPRRISLAEVMAFGDDLPDIEMLKECGISIAMANAAPEVKAVCRYQTASNDEDGVAIVLERFVAGRGT